MNAPAEDYKHLITMHIRMIAAFEYRENEHDDSKLRDLLDDWRSILQAACINADEALEQEQLLDFEFELLHSYSPYELTKSRIEKICNSVTKYLFEQSIDSIIDNDNALLVCRLLCNCHLLSDCFFTFDEMDYDNHIENVLNRLNQCIIISQIDYFSEYFRHILFDFNDEFDSVEEASAHIFHVIGVLNFKCHNYGKAICFFKKAIHRFEKESEIYRCDEYFQTRLLLAYCFEYDHNFEQAIAQLTSLDINTLLTLFKSNYINMFDLFDGADTDRTKAWSERFITGMLKNKITEKDQNALFLVADARDIVNRKNVGDKHEILHSLAHCLNELGIKWKTENSKNKDNVIHLLMLSRAIMLYVAEEDPNCVDYQTCMYMIFGEAKDYDICLKRISQLLSIYDVSKTRNVNFEMENMFYLFLVSNQSNKTIYDDKQKALAEAAYKKFVDFAKRRYDYDALIHIETFKFKFEIADILRSSFNNTEIAAKLRELKKKPVGCNIFSIKPSTKLNQWIIQEYNKTIALYEFLVYYFDNESDVKINELYNFASRFIFFRNFFTDGGNEQDTEDKERIISSVIEFIVDDFVSPQSIFLLAPLTTAIPYQQQTKNLNDLEDSLFSTEMAQIDPGTKMEKFVDLNEIYTDTTDAINIDWLFRHCEYDVSFVAYKRYSDMMYDRYRFCVSIEEVFERPILNISKVNGLITNIHRANKVHPICRNGQQSCCTTVISTENKKTIKNLCSELLVPFEKYRDKHFVYFFKGKNAKNFSHSWYVIAVNNELCPLQIEEITFRLCGHGYTPKHKLALSQNDFCYIGFSIKDSALVKNDICKLQEKYRVRFWFNKAIMEGEKWNNSVLTQIDDAKCVVFFISPEYLGNELYREILHAFDMRSNSIIIPIGYSQRREFENAVRSQIIGKDRSSDVMMFLSAEKMVYAFRNQHGFDYEEHLSEKSILLSELKKYGVVRDEQ